jgi:hypothetical protein
VNIKLSIKRKFKILRDFIMELKYLILSFKITFHRKIKQNLSHFQMINDIKCKLKFLFLIILKNTFTRTFINQNYLKVNQNT